MGLSNEIKLRISEGVKKNLLKPEVKEKFKVVGMKSRYRLLWRHTIGSQPIRTSMPEEMKQRISQKLLGHKTSNTTRKKIRMKRAKQRKHFKDTIPETKVQEYLRANRIPFVSHFYISKIAFPYQCDIRIMNAKVIIEVDGDYWHGNLKDIDDVRKLPITIQVKRIKDYVRTKQLEALKYKVIRLWESDIEKYGVEYLLKDKI